MPRAGEINLVDLHSNAPFLSERLDNHTNTIQWSPNNNNYIKIR